MSRHFRPWTIDQTQLLPAAVVDYVPADHLAQFVVALAREHFGSDGDRRKLRKSGLGQPPFDPRMMKRPCCSMPIAFWSLFHSRRIAKACAERVDFMMIVAHDAPDFRTIADFRKRHLPPLGRLFLQVLKLAEKAGLAKARACRARRHEDQGERLQTQGDELRTHEDAGDGASRRSGSAGLKLRKQPTRKRTNSTAQAVTRRRNARLDR